LANKIIDAALSESLKADPTLTNTTKNTTSIVSKQPSNVALYDNATSIQMANKLIDAASMASLNAHGSLADRG
jgi:hypothetical protein